jgi:hypothetical protein
MLHAANFMQPQGVTVESERALQVRRAHHGVEVFHASVDPLQMSFRLAII